jgi:3-oxoacyl-[acyl-carrier-protein] synthase-3
MSIVVRGCGAADASRVITNHDLAQRLDTSDAWIRERTGIGARRIGDSTTALAVDAGARALEHAGWAPDTVDVVVVATCSADLHLPATAALVQGELGITGAAFDLNAACAGFVYAFVVVDGMLAPGQRALVIGAETMSRMIDWDDRNTAVLFGDGAGAVAVEQSDEGGLLTHVLGNDPAGKHLIVAPTGGKLTMEGREVFRRAVRVTVDATRAVLNQAGASPDDVAVVVAHQANQRILDAAAERLAIPADRWISIVESTGNTSAASVPMALAEAAAAGRLGHGDLVVLVGFGAGMSWAAALLRWDEKEDTE